MMSTIRKQFSIFLAVTLSLLLFMTMCPDIAHAYGRLQTTVGRSGHIGVDPVYDTVLSASWSSSNTSVARVTNVHSDGSATYYAAKPPSTPTATPAPPTSGSCGANVTWKISNGKLTLSGSGAMYDYSSTPPWGTTRVTSLDILFLAVNPLNPSI